MTNKNMLLLTKTNGFSGIAMPIFKELKKRWEIFTIDPFKLPFLCKYFYVAKSFNINRERWRDRYHENINKYNRSPKAFLQRTKLSQKNLKKSKNGYDVIFQISSMFMPSYQQINKPYVIYLDRTLKMNEQFYPNRFSYMSNREKGELHRLHQMCFNKADRVLTFNNITSFSVINDYCIDPKKVFNIGSGVNLPELHKIQKVNNNLVLSVCADYDRHKGSLVIDAFKLAAKKLPKTQFLFVGRFINDLRGQIQSMPFIPYNDLIDLYKKASVMVMPSNLGGMQSITEAMACKCVCIASSKNPYNTGLIINRENGYLVTDENPQEIAELIIALMGDNDLRELIGKKAHDQILNNYTWPIVVSRIDKHLIELINK
jgi:glycosyltransferase involved in cell wall biosynthesis